MSPVSLTWVSMSMACVPISMTWVPMSEACFIHGKFHTRAPMDVWEDFACSGRLLIYGKTSHNWQVYTFPYIVDFWEHGSLMSPMGPWYSQGPMGCPWGPIGIPWPIEFAWAHGTLPATPITRTQPNTREVFPYMGRLSICGTGPYTI
jgi:hypothetical protein